MNQSKQRPKPEPNKVDEASAESFPASDPPSYMGSTVAGAPREDGAAKEHDRPIVTEHKRVDLNAALRDELGSLPPLSPDMVEAIVRGRPLKDWNDVRRLPGLDQKVVDELKESGAWLGD